MATNMLYLVLATLLLSAAFAMPISLNVNLVLSDKSLELTDNTATSVSDINLTVNVDSAMSRELKKRRNRRKAFRRSRRGIISYHSCPNDMLWYANQCMTFEKYERFLEDYGDDNR